MGQPEPIAHLASTMKAASEGLRLKVLACLGSNSFGVGELADIFAMPQPGMSHHLRILANAKLVESRREGNSIFYRRPLWQESHPFHGLVDQIFHQVDTIELSAEELARIEGVRSQRSLASRGFFNKHAHTFSESQSLIAEYKNYGSSLNDLLESLKLTKDSCALEIGPGDGAFLKTLSTKFNTVYAADNSSEMLAMAKKVGEASGLDNIEWFEGESQDFLKKNIKVDLLALVMVLHHMPSPSQIFEDTQNLLKPGGALLICDLCSHQEDWVRESCGDLWLGFAPSDIENWATKAGLNAGPKLFLGLKNGFQIQLRLFFNT